MNCNTLTPLHGLLCIHPPDHSYWKLPKKHTRSNLQCRLIHHSLCLLIGPHCRSSSFSGFLISCIQQILVLQRPVRVDTSDCSPSEANHLFNFQPLTYPPILSYIIDKLLRPAIGLPFNIARLLNIFFSRWTISSTTIYTSITVRFFRKNIFIRDYVFNISQSKSCTCFYSISLLPCRT